MTSFSISRSGSLAIVGLLLLTQIACASPEVATDQTNCLESDKPQVLAAPELSVLTLNMAHGRKSSLNQMLQKTSTTRTNLEEIAVFLNDSKADLIALQEADAASRWSGKFNHVEFVSQKSVYPCWIHASHASKYMYDFGTALLSRVAYADSLLHTFEPSPPTTNKGFVMGQVLWNPGEQLAEPVTVSVISVHLDFSRKKVREAQIKEMQTALHNTASPIIIMGDFNAGWDSSGSALRNIVQNGNFKVYNPEAKDLGTYKSGKKRLDWILISKDLEFVTYQVPQVVLSDHQPVLATLKLINIPGRKDANDLSDRASGVEHD